MTFSSPLFGLAFVLVVGIVGGELAARVKLPKVTGWIGIGIVLRAFGLPGLEPAGLSKYGPFTDFVLGYIAFTVGGAFHLASLRNAGKRLALLVLTEALIVPAAVIGALHFGGQVEIGAAMVMATVAIAGAPGTTVIVVQEARARGVFVKTLIAAVALIDVVAVSAFAFVTAWLGSHGSTLGTAAEAIAETGRMFGLGALVGVGTAVVTLGLARTVVGPAYFGPLIVAAIMGSWGLAKVVGTSSILACAFAGIALSNLRHDSARAADAYLHPFGGVLFAGFYTLAGMRLDFGSVLPVAGLVVLFFGGRLVGKVVSAFTAMSVARMPTAARKYLGIALLPHGGVAVGLILLVQQEPALASMHDLVASVGLAALAINQLVGPSATRYALKSAGETGLDRPRLLDFLSEQHIVVGLQGKSKREIVETLADRLVSTADLPFEKDELITQVLAREEEESTCLGEGFMIPHAILPDGEEVVGVLGISSEGIDLDAPDGRLVHAVVLLATPETEHGRHLEILAAFAAAITRDPNLREQLYHARNAAHAYQILHADDAQDFNYFMDDQMAPSRVKG
jgi:fructose PTS system EIIBC or EIIC component